MFEFALPWLLLLLPLPLLIRPRRPEQQGRALWLPFFSRWQQLASEVPPSRDPRRRSLLWLLWILSLLAAAQPRWLGEPISQPRSGRDLMLAIDISGSMADDGKLLLSTMEFEDPEVLENRGARFIAWRKQPGQYVYPYECDPTFAQEYNKQ